MSEFWIRKIRSYFKMHDLNNSGYWTREDFKMMADGFAEGEGQNSKRRHEVKEKFFLIFDTYMKVAGSDGKITEDQLVEAVANLRHDPDFKKMLEDLMRECLYVIDTDGDGYIQESEYVKFFYNLKNADHERLANIAFKALDTDQDGKLSVEETVVGYTDFILSEDESRPGTLFFGPLH